MQISKKTLIILMSYPTNLVSILASDYDEGSKKYSLKGAFHAYK
ncbi:MAG: hypothetical protein QE271_07300 [Bacteriovoracaceae bacterium]|nr:hypothetical protein [Bacteriovoracaceae bacterium]